MNTPLRDPALGAWCDSAHYDRNNPFPLFAQVRATGPVHQVRLADDQPRRLPELAHASAETPTIA